MDKIRQLEARLEDLVDSIETWNNTLMNVLQTPVSTVGMARNALRLEGHTLRQIKDIVESELKDHLTAENPHGLTREQLDVYSRDEFYEAISLYQSRLDVPLTHIKNLNDSITVDWNNHQLTIHATQMVILGINVFMDYKILELPKTGIHYIILNTEYVNNLYVSRYLISETPVVSFNDIPLLKIDVDSETIQSRDIIRVGENELSHEPRGTTIPVSLGSQAGFGSIGTNWFE